ncbi:MAG TPA: periplasmic heavy metal sensor [Prosthecobacter sp.]|jgi:Spy/CpxP family protein refolding chaperone|nr:periplasmic heavy metal sensor [Prosthecobacter sp.]
MKRILCSLLLLSVSALSAANVEDWLKSGLLHPDVIASVRDELALTEEQQTRLTQQLSEARRQAEPLEQAVKEQQKVLGHLLEDATTTADAAGAQLARLIEAEAAVKQLQLRTLIGVRDVLTPEQLQKVKKLGPPKMAAIQVSEELLKEKTGKLRAALESLGIQPTEAMKERGGEVEALIKNGDLSAAAAVLDKLIEDGGVKELEAEADEIDFSKYEPGSTDLESLKQRYQDVQDGGQRVVSLPLMRDLLQARAAFEEAKEAQDADKVGRILTYVEGRLKQL